jgi:hypothetical protein
MSDDARDIITEPMAMTVAALAVTPTVKRYADI